MAKKKYSAWTTVTPFSKILAMVLFIGLPIVAFIWGMQIGAATERAMCVLK